MKNIRQITYEDGSVYAGELDDNIKDGTGLLFIPDGSVYMGEWRDNNYNGEGVYIYPDGERYEGQL